MASTVGAVCTFEACNLLELPARYTGQFDFIFFTVGALAWFEDLDPVFALGKRCLKPDGVLLVHDSHPLLCLLPVPGEEAYREGEVRVSYPYFRKTPWLENSGMGYLSGKYDSPTFTSFTHTVSDILGGVLRAGLVWNCFRSIPMMWGLRRFMREKICRFPICFWPKTVKIMEKPVR